MIGLGASVLAGIFILLPKIMGQNKVATETQNITMISTGVKTLYSSRANFTGLSNTVVKNANIFPGSMVDTSSGSVTHSFQGAVTLDAVDFNATKDGFTITYDAVPKSDCVNLISAIGANFRKVGIGSTPDSIKKKEETTIDPAAVTNTATGCSTDSNKIVFTDTK